jgi:hypothetical protein
MLALLAMPAGLCRINRDPLTDPEALLLSVQCFHAHFRHHGRKLMPQDQR